MRKIKNSIVDKNIAMINASKIRGNPFLRNQIMNSANQENKFDSSVHKYRKIDGSGTNNYYESERWTRKMMNINF